MRKTVKKKAATKKKVATKKAATTKKTTAKKKATAKKAASIPRAKAAYTKSLLVSTIVDNAGVAKKDVTAVLDVLSDVIEAHVKKGAVGHFTLPGLLKVKTVRKKATKARKGINPFTGEETVFKAKPARTVVKILPLKKIKDMVA